MWECGLDSTGPGHGLVQGRYGNIIEILVPKKGGTYFVTSQETANIWSMSLLHGIN
jgi:hypothetical protein